MLSVHDIQWVGPQEPVSMEWKGKWRTSITEAIERHAQGTTESRERSSRPLPEECRPQNAVINVDTGKAESMVRDASISSGHVSPVPPLAPMETEMEPKTGESPKATSPAPGVLRPQRARAGDSEESRRRLRVPLGLALGSEPAVGAGEDVPTGGDSRRLKRRRGNSCEATGAKPAMDELDQERQQRQRLQEKCVRMDALLKAEITKVQRLEAERSIPTHPPKLCAWQTA